MSQELLYTSAPTGLNPSDQGFCTVVCTQGMPRNLKEFLESLSGYRQAESPPHPVNFSHLIQTIAGKRYSVLSRVSDYEKDYSGRTNKLAHHVAFTMDERPDSGPAALLSTSLFKSRWDRKTRWEPQGPLPPSTSAYQGPCRTWDAITGDAGWAGLLAESAADGSNRPMYVIFPSGQDVLPLVSEALGILPREQTWTTTFSTYFTKLPAGVDCLWRFVLDGSPEAQQARAASHSRTIDLVELRRTKRRAPEGHPFVDAARAGRVIAASSLPTSGVGTFAPSSPAASMAAPSTATMVSEAPAPSSPFAGSVAAPPSPFGRSSKDQSTSSKLPYLLGGSALVLVLGVGAIVYSMLTKVPPTVITADSEGTKSRKTRIVPQLNEEDFLSQRDKDKREAQAKAAIEIKTIEPVKVEIKTETPNVTPTPMATKVAIEGPWDRTLKTKDGYLIIPPRQQDLIKRTSAEPIPLSQIHVEDASSIDLKIHTSSSANGEEKKAPSRTGGLVSKAEDIETDDDKRIRQWIVQREVPSSVIRTQIEYVEIGKFSLANQELTFTWNNAPSWAAPNSLRYSILEISHGNQSHKFRLSQPQPADQLAYDFSARNQPLPLDLTSSAEVDPKTLYLDFELDGVAATRFSQKRIRIGEMAKFATKKPSIKIGDPQIEFEVKFEYDTNKGPYLVLNAYTTIRMLDFIKPSQTQKLETVAIETVREPMSLPQFEKLKKQTAEETAKIDRSPQYKAAITDLPMYRQKLSSLLRDIQIEANKRARDDMQAQIGKLQNIIQSLDQAVERHQVLEDLMTWANEMQSFFEDLSKSAKIGYALYTEIEGEKVYLAKTASLEPAKKPADAQSKPKGN